jgi:hypothetical protein
VAEAPSVKARRPGGACRQIEPESPGSFPVSTARSAAGMQTRSTGQFPGCLDREKPQD